MAIALPPAKSQQQRQRRRRRPRTPYEILGVKPGCTDDELKSAYRRCVREYHPDRGGDEKLFREATEAFEQVARERGDGEMPGWAATLLSLVNAALAAAARGDLSDAATHLGAVVDEVASHLHTGRALLGEQLGHAAAAREAAGRLDIGQAATHVAAFSSGVAANWPRGLAVVEGGKRLLSALTGGKKKRGRRR